MPSCSQKDDVEPCGEEKCRFTIDRTTKVTIVISKPEKIPPLYADEGAVNPFRRGISAFCSCTNNKSNYHFSCKTITHSPKIKEHDDMSQRKYTKAIPFQWKTILAGQQDAVRTGYDECFRGVLAHGSAPLEFRKTERESGRPFSAPVAWIAPVIEA